MTNIDIKFKLDSYKKLEEHIDFIKKFKTSQKDKTFQKFLQDKALETVKMFSNAISGTTDDEWIEEYKLNHKIKETSNGFILYNDTTIPTSMLPLKEYNIPNYSDGFSIAMAFEYGIGIVGENSAKVGAWEYNVNKWNFAWTYEKNGVKYSTYGYEGFEIYRKSANYIEEHLQEWTYEYYEKEVR